LPASTPMTPMMTTLGPCRIRRSRASCSNSTAPSCATAAQRPCARSCRASRCPCLLNSRVELLVLTALVLIYGPVLFGSDFGPVLEQIAECGAVVLLQRVVFAEPAGMDGKASKYSEDSQDRRIAARLQDVRPMFEALCRKFPGAFLADARALLKRFTTSPAAPGEGSAGAAGSGGEGPHGGAPAHCAQPIREGVPKNIPRGCPGKAHRREAHR
jgi:hypothetical protein